MFGANWPAAGASFLAALHGLDEGQTMDKGLIERLAKEAGAGGDDSLFWIDVSGLDAEAFAARFASLIAEECAKVVEEWPGAIAPYPLVVLDAPRVAGLIREKFKP